MDAVLAVVGEIGSFAVGPYEKNPFGRLANGDDGNGVKREGEGILQFWGDNPIFETKVKLNQDVKNAEELLAPVTAAFPSSVAAVAFNALTREVVSKIE